MLHFAHLPSPSFCAANAHFRPQLIELLRIGYRFHQHFIELFVGLQRASQIAQLGPQIQQFAQRLHLPGNVLGLEIFQALKVQIHFQLPRVRIVAELVFDRKRQMRFHACQDLVEVIRIHVDKPPVLQLRDLARRLACEVAKNPEHERQVPSSRSHRRFERRT